MSASNECNSGSASNLSEEKSNQDMLLSASNWPIIFYHLLSQHRAATTLRELITPLWIPVRAVNGFSRSRWRALRGCPCSSPPAWRPRPQTARPASCPCPSGTPEGRAHRPGNSPRSRNKTSTIICLLFNPKISFIPFHGYHWAHFPDYRVFCKKILHRHAATVGNLRLSSRTWRGDISGYFESILSNSCSKLTTF